MTDGIAGMAQAARVDGGLAPFAGLGQMTVDGDVGRDLAVPQGRDEGFDIEQLVRAKGDPPFAGPVAAD